MFPFGWWSMAVVKCPLKDELRIVPCCKPPGFRSDSLTIWTERLCKAWHVGHQLEGAVGILIQLIESAVEVLIVGAIEADNQSICKGCCGIVLGVHWSVVVRLQVQRDLNHKLGQGCSPGRT